MACNRKQPLICPSATLEKEQIFSEPFFVVVALLFPLTNSLSYHIGWRETKDIGSKIFLSFHLYIEETVNNQFVPLCSQRLKLKVVRLEKFLKPTSNLAFK